LRVCSKGAALALRKESVVIDIRILLRAFVVGAVIWVVMAVLAPRIPWLGFRVLEFGGMMISATSGYLYAMHAGKGYFPGATAGAITGGGSALIGISILVAMGDLVNRFIPFGTAVCVLTGAVGGLFGQMAHNWREFEKRQR
jgi:hypothetical protein